MMESIVFYIVRASVYLLIFTIGYFFLLRKSPQASINRAIILISGLLSVILAFIPANYINLVSGNGQRVVNLPEIVVTATGNISNVTSRIGFAVSRFEPIHYIIVICSILFLLILVIRFAQLGILIYNHRAYKLEGMVVVSLDQETSPFSFFKWLFVPKGVNNEQHFGAILAHEQAHFKRYHSIDVIFFELIKLLFWFHPAYYFMRAELRAMHEYEADHIALARFDKIEYQKTLVELSFLGGLIPITNPFNVSLIKKRLLMMNKKSKHQPLKKWLFIAAISLSVGLTAIIQSCDFRKSAEPDTDVVPQLIETPVETAAVVVDTTTSEIFTIAEQMPAYRGGVEAMTKFISENIKYPEDARSKSIQGKVFVSFVVEKDGKISNVKVLRGIGRSCDEEAIRVVQMMPDWIPGKQDGQNIRLQYNLPVKFVLH